MLGVEYFKSEPTEFVRMSVGGKVKREGAGLSGFYLPFRTSMERVSVAEHDQAFGFNEVSRDNQDVSLQGGFIYRITDPAVTLGKYNWSIDPKTKEYLSDGPEKLPQHILQLVQSGARKIVQTTSLEEILVMCERLSDDVLGKLKDSTAVRNLGISLDALYFSSIRPKPEIAKALEADYREALLQRADEAIYARRALAVEKERTILQNELQTKIGIEDERKKLVALEGENTLKQADFRAEAAKKEFEVYRGLSPAELTAHGFFALGRTPGKIEHLTITPDILAGLLREVRCGV